MVAGADLIDDLAILCQGGMREVFANSYAPPTLGLFLSKITFSHVRLFDAVASCFVRGPAARTPLVVHVTGGYLFLHIDNTIIEVHGYQKEGSGYGYSEVRSLNVFLALLETDLPAPIITSQRLRRVACGSPRRRPLDP